MAKTKISEFSATPGNNTDIDGINLAEGCAPSGINDAIRELMSQLKDWQSGTSNDPMTIGSSGSLTLSYGTANGVPYLNGSKVLTTGSALTYNGTGLGVGVASASFALDVGGSDGTNIALRSTGTSSARFRAYVNGAESGVIGFLNGGGQFFEVAGSEQMRLTSTGLGIGTSSPGARLHVQGTSSDQIRVGTAATEHYRIGRNASDGLLDFYGSQTGFQGYRFGGIDGTWMTINSAGNLGLGVTPSAWGTAYRAFEFGGGGSALFSGTSGTAQTYLTANAYFNGTNWVYKNTAIASFYEQSGGAHRWHIAPSGTAGNAISFTQAMTLDASGNLSVGTTSVTSGYRIRVQDGNNATGFIATNASGGYCSLGLDSAATSDGRITWTNALIFGASGSERARIDSSGNLLVGRTAALASERLCVEGSNTTFISRIRNTSATTPAGLFVSYTAAAPNDTGNLFFRADDNAATRTEIRSNGGIANYSGNNVNLSDRREKTNFAPAGEYLSKICAIPVQTFNYIDQNMEDDPGLTLGVVAQDVQAVAPELVMESNWGTEEEPKMRLSIYQTDLQYALMKALQELKAEFDAYKATHP